MPATCPYPEPARSSPYPTSHFLKIHLNIILLRLGSPRGLFPSGFPTKTMYTPLPFPIRATCPARFILLDFITRTIFGEQYSSLSSSLCSFLYSPVTSSLLGPNILLNKLFSNRKFNVKKFYVPPSQCSYVFHMDLGEDMIGHCAPFTAWRYRRHKGGWRNQKKSLL